MQNSQSTASLPLPAKASEQLLVEEGEKYEGKNVFTVCDLHFAAALLATGVPLVGPARMFEYAGGVRRAAFSFYQKDEDNLVDLAKCSGAAKDPIRYIAENPLNPLSFALAALMMFANLANKATAARAVVPMKSAKGEGPTIFVTKDSRMYHAALKRGMLPVSIENKPTPLQILCQ